jgi:hypothetical protein
VEQTTLSRARQVAKPATTHLAQATEAPLALADDAILDAETATLAILRAWWSFREVEEPTGTSVRLGRDVQRILWALADATVAKAKPACDEGRPFPAELADLFRLLVKRRHKPYAPGPPSALPTSTGTKLRPPTSRRCAPVQVQARADPLLGAGVTRPVPQPVMIMARSHTETVHHGEDDSQDDENTEAPEAQNSLGESKQDSKHEQQQNEGRTSSRQNQQLFEG